MKGLIAKYNELLVSEKRSFESVAGLKNVMGVYMIYGPNDELFYIGKTNKFHVRFGTDLKHESTHTLVSKLIKNGRFADRFQVKEFLKSQCQVRIVQSETSREAEAVEHMAIYLLNPKINK